MNASPIENTKPEEITKTIENKIKHGEIMQMKNVIEIEGGNENIR